MMGKLINKNALFDILIMFFLWLSISSTLLYPSEASHLDISVDPLDSNDLYRLGEWAHFSVNVSNPSDDVIVIVVDNIYPNGTSARIAEDIILSPGDERPFNISYLLRLEDLSVDEVLGPTICNTVILHGHDAVGEVFSASISMKLSIIDVGEFNSSSSTTSDLHAEMLESDSLAYDAFVTLANARSQVDLLKEDPQNSSYRYRVGESINYSIIITNRLSTVNQTYATIVDTLPDGSVISLNQGVPVRVGPLQNISYLYNYTLNITDTTYYVNPYYYVDNIVAISGIDDDGNLVNATVTHRVRVMTSNISGSKFYDLDGDGKRDSLDPGIPGWAIYLDAYEVDGTTLKYTNQTLTDGDGGYIFKDLPPGRYIVREKSVPEWNQSTTPTTYNVNLTDDNSTLDFGNHGHYSLNGSKFFDLNADGIKDPGEPGIENWSIELDILDTAGTASTGNTTTITDASGQYIFENLGPGKYKVREMAVPEWNQSTTPTERNITVTANVTGIDFGNRGFFNVSGSKFFDLNADGIRDPGEPGIENWSIELDILDTAGTASTGNTTTITDASGQYIFENLGPGKYKVREVAKLAWNQSTTPTERDITVTANVTGIDFGNRGFFNVSGSKFYDLNADGIKDPGEPGIENWSIELDILDTAGTASTGNTTTITDGSGQYIFENLGPGKYKVREVAKLAWNQSTTPTERDITVAANVTGIDFGNRGFFNISGSKFFDLNADGIKDPGEPGIENWSIELDILDTAGLNSTGNTTVLTDALGQYIFENLGPGKYKVREVAKLAWNQSTTPTEYDVTVTANVTGIDFGNRGFFNISGSKFFDLNADGIRDPGEPGIENWSIELDILDPSGINSTGNTTALTDASGQYIFENLGPGKYKVREQGVPEWNQSTTPTEYDVTVAANVTGIDFGNRGFFHVSGSKFFDLNADGIRDPGEPGIENWSIVLDILDPSGMIITGNMTSLTDSSGLYAFENLGPGWYIVREDERPGWARNESKYRLNLAANVTGLDFANRGLLHISGTKFYDLDADGVRGPDEPGIPGWNIVLEIYDISKTSVIGTFQVSTDNKGDYLFANLAPWHYGVKEEYVPGWEGTTLEYEIDLVENVSGLDLGNRGHLSINGTKFYDLNASGSRDAQEPGMPRWTIHLDIYSNHVDLIGTHNTTTDVNGSYAIHNLAPGRYVVREEVLGGWRQTYPASKNHTLQLTNESMQGVDFGNCGNLSVKGTKFYDLGNNGSREEDDPGIPNWTINLDIFYKDDMGNTKYLATYPVTTTGNGSYCFSNLAPGHYLVKENGSAILKHSTKEIVIDLNENCSGVDIGNRGNLSISGIKYHDINGNGTKDPDEVGINGWKIVLDIYDPQGSDIIGTHNVTTDANGTYSIDGLGKGKFVLWEDNRAGWIKTEPIGENYTIILNDTNRSEMDFGNWGNSKISGLAWKDISIDGILDDGESGFPNVVVALFTSDGRFLASRTTGPDGSYSFTGLIPGVYYLTFSAPEGYSFSPKDRGSDHSRDSDVDPSTGRTDDITLLPDQIEENWNAGLWRPPLEVTAILFTCECLPLEITARVIDRTDVASVVLHYGQGTLDMTRVPGPDMVWTGELPGYRAGTLINMYVEALDAHGNTVATSGEFGLINKNCLPHQGCLDMRISHLSCQNEAVQVTVESAGLDNISSVILNYGDKQMEMTKDPTISNLWAASIPGKVAGTTMKLSAQARGALGEVLATSAQISISWIQCIHPMRELKLDAFSRVCAMHPIDIEAQTLGMPEAVSVIVHAGDDRLAMSRMPGSNDRWVVTIPGQVAGTSMTIFARAIDGAGRIIANSTTFDMEWRNCATNPLDNITVRGSKFDDLDGDGTWNKGEPGLEGWTIHLALEGESPESAITKADGSYEIIIPNPKVGKYTLWEEDQVGWQRTLPTNGSYQFDFICEEVIKDGMDFGNHHYFAPEISVDKVADPPEASPGEQVDFHINVANSGNVRLSMVRLVDLLPQGLTYISDDGNGSVDGQTVTWELGEMEVGSSRSILLKCRLDKGTSGELVDVAEASGISPEGERVSDRSEAAVRVLHPEINVEKQYEQFCFSTKVRGEGTSEVSTSVVDKKIALNYHASMAGDGRIEMETDQLMSEESDRLRRNISLLNNTSESKTNFIESSRLAYDGEVPLVGERSITSREFDGGMGAGLDESFSASRVERNQTIFMGFDDNATAQQVIGMETATSFNGTWESESRWHKLLVKDMRSRQRLSGEFETERAVKIHENPVREPQVARCDGVDC